MACCFAGLILPLNRNLYIFINTKCLANAIVAQITQQMQIPLSYADAVIGTAGTNISYIRRASGATVTIQETRGVPGEMTVEISGTASQVQTAQQLIQVILILVFDLLQPF